MLTAELLGGAGTFLRQIDFLEARYTRVDNVGVWAISEPAVMFIPANRRLRISANSGTSTGAAQSRATW